jgi:hypothetical protein
VLHLKPKRHDTLLYIQLEFGKPITFDRVTTILSQSFTEKFGQNLGTTRNSSPFQTTQSPVLRSDVSPPKARFHAEVSDSIVDRRWILECIADFSNRPYLTLVIEVESGPSAPLQHPCDAPSILAELAGRVPIVDVRTLDVNTHISKGEDLVSLIVNPTRRLPIIVLTGNQREKLAIYTQKLFGTCHFASIDAQESLHLAHLGDEWRTYGGAIRVFRPGFSIDNAPAKHPRWTKIGIEQIERSGRSFVDIVSSSVFGSVTAYATESEKFKTTENKHVVEITKSMQPTHEIDDTLLVGSDAWPFSD